jgi:glucose 1-dehydrogenase
MMMRNLSIELAPHGITINKSAPGAIKTPINAALMEDPKGFADRKYSARSFLGGPSDVPGSVPSGFRPMPTT